ncbi:nucleotidyltransferase family protein [Planosporangium mesophilum]|uniref:Nucleoside-diphosphate-sugar pyrophosphorylase n=1 Tax=Planosporangium mesophilum TaxID=689768 RepID=A0A8J3X168_9ACTN|nr:sugar phosphate nucleotidyltransferase [Planosporangium mesophilum]NJC85437.1 NTP transferase domain-containing protein [Planosporangium mesophilum]GII24052.1 nucleoside-diphosphate-sugar pyrophosphorylase [Planosporangium mesophilum]
MHAIILAGGKGVRLRPYTTRLPKPLVPIGDEFSILDIILTQLSQRGFEQVTLAIGYLGHLIRSYVGDGSRWGLEIDYANEEHPLGTMGPVLQILDRLPEDFLVMNGDVLTDLDYAELLDGHRAAGTPLTVATYARQVKIDFGVLTTRERRVVKFAEKPTIDYRVSMGVYGLSKRALTGYEPGTPLGFDELVLDLLAREEPPGEYAFDGYWLDIGRPDDYDRANAEFDEIKPLLLKGA